jgi:D-tyrosyl-tRNA(Tyr) deacylase
VLQRVSRAEVRVDGAPVGDIGRGVLILLGVMRGDGPDDALRMAERCARLRFFPDAEGRMNRALVDVGGQALVVSQFTLAADGRKGRRPSFDAAAPPAEAEALYRSFVEALETLGVACATGRFGAMMEVELVNDGPVTFFLEQPADGRGARSAVAPG